MQINHKLIAEDTLKIIDTGYYINHKNEKVEVKQLTDNAVNGTQLYTPAQLEELTEKWHPAKTFTTQFEVTAETTLNAVRKLATETKDILCLNFASAKNPGGGFLGGAVAQEESIARASALYPCLLTAPGYYQFHRSQRTCLYSDHMIYSPAVPVFKHENGSLMHEAVNTSIITSPAVNAGVVRRNEPGNSDKILPAMKNRMEKMLSLCASRKHTNLVLGAWGCGVFQNEPEEIAELFEYFLKGKFAGAFQRVTFAVKSNNEKFINPFRKRFL